MMMMMSSIDIPAERLAQVVFFPFIAPPNGGKGTQTSRISDHFHMPRLDMGSMLRALGKEDSPLARKVQERLAAGLLVDIDTVIDVLKDGIAKELNKGSYPDDQAIAFILDGFPRNKEQTDALLNMCRDTKAKVGAAVYLDVPYDVIKERAANRRICADCGAIYNLAYKAPEKPGVCDVCGGTHLEHRVDDQPEKVQVRLEGFDADTLPILETFEREGLLHRVDGNRAVDAVTEGLIQLMDACLKKVQPV